MKFVVAVPARLESTRLPRKVLADIGGQPMLRRVLDAARTAQSISEVVLCTDSPEIVDLGTTWGYRVLLTSPSCSSGSERIASVVGELNSDVVINVQGDQPFVDPLVIESMCNVFRERTPTPPVVTPIYRLPAEKLANPDVVKVVVSAQQRALYFSRAAVPFVRGQEQAEWHQQAVHWGHVGMYGYRADVLAGWSQLLPSLLEDAEKLEQLRLLDNGITIETYEITAHSRNTLSVDSPSDLERARELVNQ
ncbi:MAG: 3-deoxy-manno-octulosonate cytidylyltransferase [Ilumatobacteraceae bacterium]|nr:3-deoxy-manno-octulosonate cytidylyltransferase [Ilumatobacteraceae bacterium]